MKTTQSDLPSNPELNLKEFLKNAWAHKFLYIASILVFGALGYGYLKWAPPVYEADTSILVNTQGSGRLFTEGNFRDGGLVGDSEKNLFNEMNILKSVGLVQSTIEDLDIQVSYHSQNIIIKREHYKDFPFRVKLIQDKPNQLVNVPIYVKMLSDASYQLTINVHDYEMMDQGTGEVGLVENPLIISREHRFDEPAQTEYYNFTIEKIFDQNASEAFIGKELFFMIHPINDLVRSFQNKLSVTQVDLQASILNITSEGEVLEKEIDFLNQLTSNYINSKISERNKVASNKVSFIDQQLSSITDSLTHAERSLELFRRNSDAVNLTQTGASALEEYQEIQNKQAQADLNLKYYKSLLKYVKDSNGINQIVAPSIVGIDDALLSDNLMELKRLSSELSRVRFLKGPKSYDVEVIQHQIENTRKSVEENLRNLINSTSITVGDYADRESRLARTIDQLPTREKKLITYQRKTKLFENLYNYLSQELAKTGIAQAEDLSDVRIINHARMLGDSAKSPNKAMIMFLSLLLGLLVPSVIVTLKGEIDESISNIKVIEKRVKIPVLAQIATDPSIRKKETIFAEHWQTKESIRDLHANIKFFLPNYYKKVIAVTSSVPGEGKSFVAANLALTMASAGNSVLLIDADFRNPSLSRHFGVDPTTNFSTYLNGWTEETKEIIHTHQKYRNLDYITTTAASTNPHRYLQNPKFEFMIIGLKDEYDHIIIDCPAVGLVSDYLLLFHLADIHLFVTRQKFSKQSYLKEIEKFKEKGNVENLYLVLNGVPGKKLKHGYFAYDASIDQGTESKKGPDKKEEDDPKKAEKSTSQ
ncbi:MAG: polysaccharide biosynthesis tyrosine autokinase [Saprospiraceae bacterium]|nr:polysaccharide biosynthesis tyrosine autokinase [Saprospiraceae bacterium]